MNAPKNLHHGDHSKRLHELALSLTTAGMALLPGATAEELSDIDPDARINAAIDELNSIRRQRKVGT